MDDDFEFKDQDTMEYDLRSSMNTIVQLDDTDNNGYIYETSHRKQQAPQQIQSQPKIEKPFYNDMNMYQQPISEKFISISRNNIYMIIGIILSIILIYLFVKMYIRQAKMEFLLNQLITHQMIRH